MTERYTPGHTKNAVEFMARRSLASHGAFFLPYLRGRRAVLDCGCGPGTITCEIAKRLPSGKVVGIDIDASQVKSATEQAAVRSVENVQFRCAGAYDLPYAEGSFDAVFSHALLEHLSEPGKAISEFSRVLQPGGMLAVCSPDWGGFLLAPPSESLTAAIEAYKAFQISNGGDVYVGRKFSRFLENAGFEQIRMQARYEVYESLNFIGEYLVVQLENAGESLHAATLREWAAHPNGMFAQAWVSCVGKKAGAGC